MPMISFRGINVMSEITDDMGMGSTVVSSTDTKSRSKYVGVDLEY